MKDFRLSTWSCANPLTDVRYALACRDQPKLTSEHHDKLKHIGHRSGFAQSSTTHVIWATYFFSGPIVSTTQEPLHPIANPCRSEFHLSV
jgi:hypothetical protein